MGRGAAGVAPVVVFADGCPSHRERRPLDVLSGCCRLVRRFEEDLVVLAGELPVLGLEADTRLALFSAPPGDLVEAVVGAGDPQLSDDLRAVEVLLTLGERGLAPVEGSFTLNVLARQLGKPGPHTLFLGDEEPARDGGRSGGQAHEGEGSVGREVQRSVAGRDRGAAADRGDADKGDGCRLAGTALQ